MLGCKGWKGQKKGIAGIKMESKLQREIVLVTNTISLSIIFENLFRVTRTDETFKYIYPEWLL